MSRVACIRRTVYPRPRRVMWVSELISSSSPTFNIMSSSCPSSVDIIQHVEVGRKVLSSSSRCCARLNLTPLVRRAKAAAPRANPCTRHRPSGRHVLMHFTTLWSLISPSKSNLIILHQHPPLYHPSRFRHLRPWQQPRSPSHEPRPLTPKR
jgi:hypothetical protein